MSWPNEIITSKTKIMLRQQANVVNDEWMKAYEHFRLRLNERYNLDISFKEYVLLTKERVDKIKVTSKNKCLGWLTIRGQKVLVCKEMKRNRFLSTALNPNSIE